MRPRILVVSLLALLFASSAFASWYDDYDAGLNAARAGNWQAVVQRMTAAIKGNGKENDKARTYGAIFINYHPYYYRGVANLNLGRYEQAISDFETSSGPGEENLGSIETLMGRAKSKLASASTPPAPEPQPAAPAPTPVPVQPRPTPPPVPMPQPPTPAAPSIDPALRGQVQAAINEANKSLAGARGRKAQTAPAFTQALQAVADANTRSSNARSNDDLRAALTAAQNAKLFADNATGPAAPAPVPTVAQTRPSAAADSVLADSRRRVRVALEKYFAGDFEDAAREFKQLSVEMPRNAWIWAFLGASQYSRYAFEAEPSYKASALESFRKAKQFGRWNNGLPQKYFSKRIRSVFQDAD